MGYVPFEVEIHKQSKTKLLTGLVRIGRGRWRWNRRDREKMPIMACLRQAC